MTQTQANIEPRRDDWCSDELEACIAQMIENDEVLSDFSSDVRSAAAQVHQAGMALRARVLDMQDAADALDRAVDNAADWLAGRSHPVDECAARECAPPLVPNTGGLYPGHSLYDDMACDGSDR